MGDVLPPHIELFAVLAFFLASMGLASWHLIAPWHTMRGCHTLMPWNDHTIGSRCDTRASIRVGRVHRAVLLHARPPPPHVLSHVQGAARLLGQEQRGERAALPQVSREDLGEAHEQLF